MKITIIGCGYVGLVTGACMSDIGHDVLCLDIDAAKIKKLNKGVIPIYEKGLDSIVSFNLKKKRLNFTTSYKKAVTHSDIIFIAVDTPSKKNGDADLSSIVKTSQSISQHMSRDKIIIEKSTVPVGTSDYIQTIIMKGLKLRNKKLNISMVSNPEFLKEGSAVDDFMKPDRIIIGLDNQELQHIFNEMYLPFNRKYNKIHYMDVKSAELTKYAANAMLATKISFINEIAILSDKLGVDIESIRKGIGADKRIGKEFLYPGCGYGGSCFPKDVKALISTAKKISVETSLLKSVHQVNDAQKQYLVEKVKHIFKNKIKGKKFAIWGLAFKPNTDDVRDAPSITIIKSLLNGGAHVIAYDPIASLAEIINSSRYNEVSTAISALHDVDALIICTEWKEFWSINTDIFIDNMKKPIIFDGRNIFSPEKMMRNSIEYYGVGRGLSLSKK
ncbi:MAG: UDP-glucose/GDP-mannose dehydrogenase family protein [Gammaproteobacteria bacterium]|jgi:UDPglucose 6-dehydrogenase|nr:UDP-glucose/GDP-mannose dehydrogenase family protein [Gammaproteobacteria bacterium]MBT4462000.1 UDP-glucose/GDP-mannose dehydrogenase family protein [Gammaproteobacteria bacterium]MBT4654512.1 UDP-glucose/GDP-mannose dehydrogenase family protein [Gammaproteobacteria bacterium]MBT5116770.1 UDP-glucose/GDP-mannose dehydrogenase family protein [Gammaproteobacteria bacterium]MBT5761453.1 UDP-glucose/GDP-mannose dehydrogenase family protein [Gammaproteobacteria bacterium]